MDEVGTAHAIGALQVCHSDPITQAQMEKCIARLDNINDPAGRSAARNRDFGGDGNNNRRYVDD